MNLKLTEIYSYETNKDYAYRMIRENIMDLELLPGSIISEKELAENLNISRTPIREILFRLQNQNLIEVIPQGTRVTKIDESLIDEALDMRFALEQQVILRLQNTQVPEGMKEMENIVDLQEFYIEKKRIVEAHEQDMRFHQKMYKSAGRERTWDIIKGFSTHFDRIRRLKSTHDTQENLVALVSNHREYICIIREQAGADEIAQLLDKHLISNYRAWFEDFRKRDDWNDFAVLFKDTSVTD